jgi:hypothetical protein
MCGSSNTEPRGERADPVTPPSNCKEPQNGGDRKSRDAHRSESGGSDLIVIYPHSNLHLTASQESISSELIVIDDSPVSSTKKRRASEVIVLDDENSRDQRSIVTPHAKISQLQSMLSFSVSKNSGRILIHWNETGRSSHVNFDIEQIVSDATADAIINHRSANKLTVMRVEFNDGAVERGTKLLVIIF